MVEQGQPQAHNEEAWGLYMKAERRELQMRREGHLARLLGSALPDESPEELERITEEDRLRAEEGLVELLDKRGQITYKHIDDLGPGDRSARIRAEGARIERVMERWIRKRLSPPRPSQRNPADG